MKTEKFKASEVSRYRKWKWIIQDMTGLFIHKFIAQVSSDQEVKELYQDMREALIEEGDQPKALQISQEIRSKIMMNTQERLN